jgi:hypothetical protein
VIEAARRNSQPATVAEAVDAYERDLVARGGSVANAGRIRKHLTPTLASKPVGLLTARELAAWRDGLLGAALTTATVVRICKATKAALNLTARRDHRITNRNAWSDGLSGITEDYASRNVQRLDDEQVRAVVSAAHEIDAAFGLYVEVAAVTGARLSQIAQLIVADLQADNGTPRLLMPASRKGRSRKGEKRPVPIPVGLAAKLNLSESRCCFAVMVGLGSRRTTATTRISISRPRRGRVSLARSTRCDTAASAACCWPTCQCA